MKKMKYTVVVFLVVCSNIDLSAQEKKKQNIFKELFGVSVQETSDKFDGTTTYQMEGNKVFTELSGTNALGNLIFGTDAPTFKTFLNLEKHVQKDGTHELAILFKVEAENEQFAEVMEGESLIFLLDNERFDLTTKGSYNSDFDIDAGGVSSVTNARYTISKNVLEKINASEKVGFRIILDSFQSGAAEGRDKNGLYLDGEFTNKNKKVWREFEVDYLND